MIGAFRELLGKLHATSWALVPPLFNLRRRYRVLSLPADGAVPAAGRGVATGSVRLRAITRAEDLAAFAPQWHDLFEQTGCRLPFLHFSWVDQWWRTFGRSLPFLRNDLLILVAEHDERVVGILPFYQTTYGALRPFSMRYIRPIGSDPNLTEVRTVLMRPGYEAAVLTEAGRYFARRAEGWDLLNWGSYPESLAPGSDVRGHWFSVDRHDPIEMFLLDLPGSWDAFASTLKRNTKEGVRRAYNAPKRDGRTVAFRCLSGADEISSSLPTFFELHRHRAELPGAVPHPDVFRRAAHKRFLRNVTRAMARDGLVKLFVLDVDGVPVAMRLGFTIHDTLYCYYSGFDPAFAKYSVMTRLVVEMYRWAMDRGIGAVNLSTGRDQSKLRWNPTSIRFQTYSQIGSRFRSRAAFALFARP